MRLLNKLNNDHLNINDKINIIKKYNVLNDNFRPNILEGGLFVDWDFDINIILLLKFKKWIYVYF